MCNNCGLIFDYQFDPEGPGWPRFELPWDAGDEWLDEKGELHTVYPELSEFCPRCSISFQDIPAVPVVVRESKTLSDFFQPGDGEGLTL
jgi:hypothetical protein